MILHDATSGVMLCGSGARVYKAVCRVAIVGILAIWVVGCGGSHGGRSGATQINDSVDHQGRVATYPISIFHLAFVFS